MPKKLIPLAISYDFDGTLAPGNMQEYEFVPQIGMTKKEFWNEVDSLAQKHDADNILIYMGLMLKKAQAAEVPVHRSNFEEFGKNITLFPGVQDWFKRINAYGKEKDVKVEHFIISSGIREMISGTPIANKFKAIFASSFWYDHNDIACWPALALNYTTKTQYLFRINKGNLNVFDHSKINEYIPKKNRPIPFENMIFIGDGLTDIPCFRLVKSMGGHSIAVYKSGGKGAKERAQKLTDGDRVNFIVPADYQQDKELDKTVMAIIDKVAADGELKFLGKLE